MSASIFWVASLKAMGNRLLRFFNSNVKKKKIGTTRLLLTVLPFEVSSNFRFPKTTANVLWNIAAWNNAVHTSLYRWWNFVILNLIEQVIIPSNTYFICMALLQALKPISDSGGIPTFLLPIFFVLTVTMVKDAYEDIQRHRSDNVENSRITHLVKTDGTLVDVQWKCLRPGDIVKVNIDELIPADLVILNCADPSGMCHLETIQLDGETTLKGKTCIMEIKNFLNEMPDSSTYKLEITYDVPTDEIYAFHGILKLFGHPSLHDVNADVDTDRNDSRLLDTKQTRHYSHEPNNTTLNHPYEGYSVAEFPLTISQFLWRSTTLCNTEWITGVVVYSGFDSLTQHSMVEQCGVTTQHVFFLCVVGGLAFSLKEIIMSDNWYLNGVPNVTFPRTMYIGLLDAISSPKMRHLKLGNFLYYMGIAFGRYALLLSYLVPITLFVQLEIVKRFQAYFFQNDANLLPSLSPDTEFPERYQPRVHTVSLMEELGCITHVFTDKTGTLTLNLMQLRCLGIGNTLYGYGDVDDPLYTDTDDFHTHEPYFGKQKNVMKKIQSCVDKGTVSTKEWSRVSHAFCCSPNPYVDFHAWRFLKHIKDADVDEVERIRNLFYVLALCHSVFSKSSYKYQECFVTGEQHCVQASSAFTLTPETSQKHADDTIHYVQLESIGHGEYDASSPDERALVCGASHIGLEFVSRPTLNAINLGFTNSVVRRLMLTEEHEARCAREIQELNAKRNEKLHLIERFPDFDTPFESINWKAHSIEAMNDTNAITPVVTFEILEVLQFDNIRKKMSVIMKDCQGLFRLLTKGADNCMIQSASRDQHTYIRTVLERQLLDLAREGLRTLVFGTRLLTEEEVTEFRSSLAKLRLTMDSEALLIELYDRLEQNLNLLGCTGIDDKLQPQVPEVITDLRRAGIKTWILTGDKLETAVSIGKSCAVVGDDTYNAIVNGSSEDQVLQQLQKYMSFIVAGQLSGISLEKKSYSKLVEGSDQSEIPFHLHEREEKENQESMLPCTRIKKYTNGVKNVFTPLCCGSTRKYFRQPKTRGGERQCMMIRWDDFVKTLLHEAKHTSIIPDSHSSQLVKLNSNDVEKLLRHYLASSQCSDTRNSMDLSTDNTNKPSTTGNSDEASPHSTTARNPEHLSLQNYNNVAVTCTGDALSIILKNQYMKSLFFGISQMSTAVIACRVTPGQKASLVRETTLYSPSTVSLAIGDGANDVGMITAANVGVGITGHEGAQASRAADFSIAEFRMLRHVLFHHGLENLRRNSFQVYHTIYRNFLFGFVDWFFGLFSMFSAIDIYSTWLKQIFNLLFTPIPPLIFSISDRCLPGSLLTQCAWVYPSSTIGGYREKYFGQRKFILWLLYGVYSGGVILVVPIIATFGTAVQQQGLSIGDLRSFGHFAFWLVVLISNVILLPFSHTWYWFSFVGYGFSLSTWFISLAVCSSGMPLCRELSSCLQIFDSSAVFHTMSLLCIVIILLPLLVILFYQSIMSPDIIRIIRERIRMGVFDVVVMPKVQGNVNVIVPRHDDKEWRGFAFAEGVTRLEHYRELRMFPNRVKERTAALSKVAKNIFSGKRDETDESVL